VLAFHISTHK